MCCSGAVYSVLARSVALSAACSTSSVLIYDRAGDEYRTGRNTLRRVSTYDPINLRRLLLLTRTKLPVICFLKTNRPVGSSSGRWPTLPRPRTTQPYAAYSSSCLNFCTRSERRPDIQSNQSNLARKLSKTDCSY